MLFGIYSFASLWMVAVGVSRCAPHFPFYQFFMIPEKEFTPLSVVPYSAFPFLFLLCSSLSSFD